MAKRKRLALGPLDVARSDANSANTYTDTHGPNLRLGLAGAAPIAQVAGHAAAHAALAEMSNSMDRARAEGRLVLQLSLKQIDTDHLMRDRIDLDEEDLAPLIASLKAHGQRTPIEVVELPEGRFGLISGWRRVQALTRLHSQTGQIEFSQVQALLRRPETAQEAYIAMVEENEIRLGLSYYERARIAARSVDAGVFETEKQALQKLFETASRARRSKIGSFLSIYRALDGYLQFPASIPERLGLALATTLTARPDEINALVKALAEYPAPSVTEEHRRIAAFISNKSQAALRQKGTVTTDLSPRREIVPGVFLQMSTVSGLPVMSLSGPMVDEALCADLENWLTKRLP